MQIVLSCGAVTWVDDDVYVWASQYSWHLNGRPGNRYVSRCTKIGGKQKIHRLHNEILGVVGVDHNDCDPLNNLRGNLRPANASQQGQNTRKRKGCSSRFKGVSHHKQNGRWQAEIKPPGQKKIFLGYFDEEQDAARIYDEHAKRLFGEFAKLNFPN